MKYVSNSIIDAFIEASHEVARQGLVRCSSGNLSVRVEDDLALVSASRSWLERITPEQVTVCRISDAQPLEGPPPTVEIGFHAGILRQRPETNVVLHYQTPAATALACMSSVDDINFAVIPEIPFYMGAVGIVPYLTPGTPELASAVIETMARHTIALMRNHGQITVAEDYDHAIQNGVFLELAANIILSARDRLQPLSEDSASLLIQAGASSAGKV